MDFFLKNQKKIFRFFGVLLILVSFTVYFWGIPQKSVTKNDLAANNIARMEAAMQGHSYNGKNIKSGTSSFSKVLAKTQKKQMQYLIILIMVFGIGFLGYSFMKKNE